MHCLKTDHTIEGAPVERLAGGRNNGICFVMTDLRSMRKGKGTDKVKAGILICLKPLSKHMLPGTDCRWIGMVRHELIA